MANCWGYICGRQTKICFVSSNLPIREILIIILAHIRRGNYLIRQVTSSLAVRSKSTYYTANFFIQNNILKYEQSLVLSSKPETVPAGRLEFVQ